MKKVTLLLGALVLGFVLTSCESKKDSAIKMFNTFFDEEVAALNQVEDADAFLAYYDAADKRFDDFFNMLNEKLPINENDEIIGMKKADSDAAMQVYNDRLDAYIELRDSKSAALYEPIIASLEDYWNNDVEDLVNQYDNVDDIPDEVLFPVFDELDARYSRADQYMMLSNDEQFDRYLTFYYLLDDEAEEEEGEEEE